MASPVRHHGDTPVAQNSEHSFVCLCFQAWSSAADGLRNALRRDLQRLDPLQHRVERYFERLRVTLYLGE
jgi:hypothetical protein